eukprot:gene7171-7977_t
MTSTAKKTLYENFRQTHGSGASSGAVNSENTKDYSVEKYVQNEASTITAKPIVHRRLNSPNVGNWDPDIRLLQSSDKWIGVYGLKKLKLELQQILPTIGFKHSDAFVKSLKKPISARYSKGLFTRVPYKDGSVYNLVATRDKLRNIEKQLQQAVLLYKKRLEWLTSESRRIFGVIEEKCVCIVLDIQSSSEVEFNMYIQSLVQTIKEQVMFISKINLVRVAIDAQCWQESSTCVTVESINSALDWVLSQPMKTEVSATSTIEAILKTMSDADVEAVYLYTEGSASDTSREIFKRKLNECGKQLNVVSFNCAKPSTLSFLTSVSKIGGGRFHAFSMYHESEEGAANASLLNGRRREPTGSYVLSEKYKERPAARIGYGLREDVMKIWEELDQSRNTLAEIQALLVEFESPQKAMKAISDAKPPKVEVDKRESKGELYMGSKQWLTRHGLKSKKLSFFDFLHTLTFKHCDAVVDIQHPPKNNIGDAVVKQKLVNAKYCSRFAHVKWKDGALMHVHISGPMHRNYEERILASIQSYRRRAEWLQQGSRELFGTIIEDRVVILIDTSSSMATRLNLVKEKMQKLMQEQLRHKKKFNIIQFDSRVQPWREHVVDCNSHNLENAWLWVKGLSASGSTNTLGALKRALADTQIDGVYLLTDGRPDQPPSTVLAQANLLNTVPVHAISFNCADAEANEFLFQMASETGGRFHYFSDEAFNNDGPRPYESEDLKLLKEEIEKGLADLQKVNSLRDECTKLDWHNQEKEKCLRHQRTRDPSTLERPRSAMAATSPARLIVNRASEKRRRPLSAKVSSRSTVDQYSHNFSNSSIYQNAKGPITPVAPNKASQLRLNAAAKSQDSDDWMLRETRDYLDQGARNASSKTYPSVVKGKKKKKLKQRSRSPGSSMSRWLKKNDLVTRKLTILDALAPTMIPHTTKYVPILDKHVLSKVFDQVLPLAHASGRDRNEVQIINPQASNLNGYEEKLKATIEEYKSKLDQFVFPVLSDKERLRHSSEGIPSFSENRESMLNDLEKNDWPVKEDIIVKFEDEIKQAEVFLSQSRELRETSKRLSQEAAEKQRQIKEQADMQSNKASKASTKERTPPRTIQASSSTRHLRNQRVIARNSLDGYFYNAIVAKCLNSRYIEVDFDCGEKQVISARHVIPVGGARPCPTLKVADYVLVRSKLPVEEDDDDIPDFEFCFVPGIVQVTPLRQRSASKCYTVMRFNGQKITALRNDLIKITRSRFIFSCRFIRDAQRAAYKSSSPIVLYPSADKIESMKEESRISSSRSSRLTASSSDEDEDSVSEASSNRSSRSNTSSQSSSSKSSNTKGHSSGSSSSSSSTTPVGTPAVTPRSQSPEPEQPEDIGPDPEETVKGLIDEFKRSMEEEYTKQMSGLESERQRLNELQMSLAAQQQEQEEEIKRQQNELHDQRKHLEKKQQELFQRQLDQQQENQKSLIEEQRKLQAQQNDLVKKQRSQNEQLLQARFNQAQMLSMEGQKLAEKSKTMEQGTGTDLNGVDQETETELSSEDKHTETERKDSKDSQTSPMSSRKSSVSEGHYQELDEVDNKTQEQEELQQPPEIKMFIGGESEAVLVTSGKRGLLLSRKSPAIDPAVTAQDLPRPLKAGEEVLARWSDDGWYYRGTIKQDCGDSTYYVEDSVGYVERIVRQDIITDEDDADNVIKIGSPVVSLHPNYPYSYAPDKLFDARIILFQGVVLKKQSECLLTVRSFDGQEAVVTREEMYLLSHEKFERDCAYIDACEEGLVGQAIVARNNTDGMFYLGAVRERVKGPRNYLIEWADQTLQIQNYAFIFGAHTKRRSLNIGDHILAIADQGTFAHLPGEVIHQDNQKVTVKFCNNTTLKDIDPEQAFWISPDYYERSCAYYEKANPISTPEETEQKDEKDQIQEQET